MGKRELLLIVAFVLVGVVVYHATAPPPKAGTTGFSIGGLLDRIRSEIHGENAEAEVSREARAAVTPGIKRLHLPDYRGTVTVIGEDREDVVGELRGTAYGMDDRAAQVTAKGIALTFEPRAEQIVATVTRPEQGRRPQFDLTLRLPKALACSLSARGQMEVRGIAELKLLDARGKVVARDVGLISGDLNNGTLEVIDAREITLRTERTDIRIERVAEAVTLNARRGQVRVQHVGGPTKVTLERVDAEMEDLQGPSSFEAHSGQLFIRQIAAPIEISGDNVEIELVLDKAVPITASTSNHELRVRLGTSGVTIDAQAKDGEIRIADRSVPVTDGDHEQHVAAPMNGGGPTLRLRNEGSAIIIR